jgi:hypothetical protein
MMGSLSITTAFFESPFSKKLENNKEKIILLLNYYLTDHILLLLSSQLPSS